MNGPYRDGKVHVLAEQCSTCIFRPGNLMNLQEGRVKDMIDSTEGEGAITCHQTLPYGEYEADPAICRGFFDSQKRKHHLLQLAERMGVLEEDPAPTKRRDEPCPECRRCHGSHKLDCSHRDR